MKVFLIDADNLSSSAWIEEACNVLESTEGTLAVRRAYGSAENLKGLAQTMQSWAIRPFVNLSLTKNTTDVALAVDAMELACQSPRPGVSNRSTHVDGARVTWSAAPSYAAAIPLSD